MARSYTAEIGGSSWGRCAVAEFSTISACRAWAESYGTTADWCLISSAAGVVVAKHQRDTSGTGMRWYRAYGYSQGDM